MRHITAAHLTVASLVRRGDRTAPLFSSDKVKSPVKREKGLALIDTYITIQ